MYRVVIFKKTGKLVPGQMQSGGDTHPDPGIDDAQYAAQNLQVMIDNAVAAGYKKKDIDAKFVSDEDYAKMAAESAPVPDYRALRVHEYPPIADYVDGIVKGDQKQIDKYIADCLAVKAKYPEN